ncbi:MAG TPA: ABC transporter permease [Acidobacteriota bacterium]|nr:ABC transporter permease [Acidobacteriota bacterium]
MNLGRIRHIILKEILVTFRDAKMRAMLIGPPLLQLIIFGYAVNLDVGLSRLAWLDRDGTAQSRELAGALQGSRYFRISRQPANERQMESLLERGSVTAAVHVMPGFGRDVISGRPGAVQVLVDGSDSNTASIVSGYLTRALNQAGARLRPTEATTLQRVELRSRVWFNPDLRSQDYFVPGVVVNIIGLVTILLTSMAVVREKEIGTLEQLMVTPISRLELMLGKTLPFAVVGLAEMALVTLTALLVFDIPLAGSWSMLLLGSALFIPTTLGVGLLISTVSNTQQQAVMGSFFFFLPSFLLSGFAFPIRNMPEPVQWITLANPMRYFLELVRGVFLKGTGLEILWPQCLVLTLMAAATIALSTWRFQKRNQ